MTFAMKLILTSGILFAMDYLTKTFALNNSDYFHTVINTGIAFSIPIPNSIMILIAPLLIGYSCHLIIKEFGKKTISFWICALLIAGGIGNLFDRIVRGGVVDFIELSFWPSFNFADTYLTIAAFLLIINYGKIVRSKKNQNYGKSKRDAVRKQ